MPVTQTAPQPQEATAPRVLTSAALLQGARKVLIAHDGDLYTLQLTRQGKLLLTK